MEIHADSVLLSVLASITKPLADLDVALVDMHIGARKSANEGLTIALEQEATGKAVVLFGFLNDQHLADDIRWQAVKGTPRIKYLRLPVRKDAIVEACQEVIKAEGKIDQLARELVGIAVPEDRLATLQHDLTHAKANPALMSLWLEKAREAGYEGANDDVIAAVQYNEMPMSGPFAGADLEGVFCDIEGTLIRESELNRDLVERLENLAKEKWITLWTGGSVKKISATLRQHGIYWKVTSKHLFRETHVEHVIDDLLADEFSETYRISYDTYEKVN